VSLFCQFEIKKINTVNALEFLFYKFKKKYYFLNKKITQNFQIETPYISTLFMSSEFLKPKFLKPNLDSSDHSASSSSSTNLERLNELESEHELAKFNTNRDLSLDVQRQQLPIFRIRNHILYALETHRVLVVIGETGSGKSTQLPQYLMESGWCDAKHMICVTEPRRIAAVNLARRVCDEKYCVLGREVGYSIRFEDAFTPGLTRIKFVTDGLLIRELMQNPMLPQYSVIILDEAHERNINTDIVIGLLKKVMRKRADLKLIVCSATIDAEEIKLYFDEGKNKTKDQDDPAALSESLSTTIISIQGRYYPIEISYLSEACDNYVKAAAKTAFAIHMTKEEVGDILIFLTGQDEVDECVTDLIEKARELKSNRQSAAARKLWVLPLYGSLPVSEQLKVFERTPPNTRKIIVSTNIAETSLTINGIVYVVDCGFMKLKAYDPRLGCESLITVPVSKSSADQRAGRAGRYRSGKAYRLYTESEYEKLKQHTTAEMQRCDLAPVVIQLKALGIDNICRFGFLSPPPSSNLISSLELLHALEALDHNSKLTTPLGYQMAEFPLHPTHAKALLSAPQFECTQEMLSIIAMLQVQHIFQTPSGRKQQADKAKLKFTCIEGDHITMLNVFKTFLDKSKKRKSTSALANWCYSNFLNYKSLVRAVQIREQLSKLLRKFRLNTEASCGDRTEPILKCLCVAFFVNTAKATYTADYRHVKSNLLLKVHPSSVVNLYLANIDKPPPKFVLYNDIVQSKSVYLMRDISVIDCNWLHELVPNYYEFGTEREIRESASTDNKRLRLE
jgi:ATP-dependent RNA helicase DDX35